MTNRYPIQRLAIAHGAKMNPETTIGTVGSAMVSFSAIVIVSMESLAVHLAITPFALCGLLLLLVAIDIRFNGGKQA